MTSFALLAGGLVAIAVAVMVVAFAIAPERPQPPSVSRAITAIEQQYAREARTQSVSAEHFKIPDWMGRLAERLSPAGIATIMQRRLDVAGNPRGWTSDRMLAVKGLALIVLAVIGALLGLHNIELLILGGLAGAAAGFFLPDVLLYNSGQKRQQKIPRELPDALDMLTICVEAGLGFDAALAQVARHSKGPVAAEFARVLQEIQIGKSRSEAMRALGERTTVPELKAFTAAVVQAAELGIPIAHVLREQAREMRVRRRQRAEEQAQKVPVKITFPLIMFLFPALLIVVVGPGVIEIAHALFGK